MQKTLSESVGITTKQGVAIMGVDTEIRLPPNVRLRDVAVVMGILAGLPKQWYNGYIIVDGAKPRPGCSPRDSRD